MEHSAVTSFLIIISGAAAIACLLTCVVAQYKSDTLKSAYFNLLAMAVMFYMTGFFIEFNSTSYSASMVGIKLAWLGMPFIPPLWYLCIREYCGDGIHDKKIVLLIMVIPVILVILALTWESNQLLFEDFWDPNPDEIGQLEFKTGPLYLLKLIYMYLFGAAGVYTILKHYIHGTPRFKRHAIFFFISALFPVMTTATYMVRVDGHPVDLLSIALSFTVLLFFFALQKYGYSNFSAVLKDRVIEDMREGVMLFDTHGVFMNANQTSREIFPQIKDIPMGTTLDELPFLPFTMQTLQMEDASFSQEFYRETNGVVQTFLTTVSRIMRDKKILGYSIAITNISQLKNQMMELEHKSRMDPLTRLYNRGFFFEKSVYLIELAMRNHQPVSVIMFDLDHFKRINDTWGHACGDYVLRTVAALCSDSLRKTDVLGRYGGEEFCVFLPDTDQEAAYQKAEKLRATICDCPFEFEGESLKVTASFGVATMVSGAEQSTLDELLQQADVNLYRAKNTGRNRVIISGT